jgi:hypothetical protein
MNTIELIKQWGADRGITINGTHRGQWLKLVSELGELCDNLAKGRDIKDDIGDMLVVVLMICEIHKIKIKSPICNRKFSGDENTILNSLLINITVIQEFPDVIGVFGIINSLAALAQSNATSLDECMEIAYDDIKDRKGFLNAEGVFIKEAQS